MLKRLCSTIFALGLLACVATVGLEAMGLLFQAGVPDPEQRAEALVARLEADLGPAALPSEMELDPQDADRVAGVEPGPDVEQKSAEAKVPEPSIAQDPRQAGRAAPEPVRAATLAILPIAPVSPAEPQPGSPAEPGPQSGPHYGLQSVPEPGVPAPLAQPATEPPSRPAPDAAAARPDEARPEPPVAHVIARADAAREAPAGSLVQPVKDCGAACGARRAAPQAGVRPAAARAARRARAPARTRRAGAYVGGGLGCPVLGWLDAVLASG